MKYFTRKWIDGRMSEKASEKIKRDYWNYLKKIKDALPTSIRKLAFKINVHDGLMRDVIIREKKERELVLKLRCGNLQVGYYDLDLTYKGFDLKKVDRKTLFLRLADKETELLYDEVAVMKDAYQHSIIFWPKGEVRILFKSLKIQTTQRRDRRFLRRLIISKKKENSIRL